MNDAPEGRKKNVGTDIYAQAKWNIKKWDNGGTLNLDTGVDHAMLGKGHHAASTGSEYKSRRVTTFFSRLQMEF